jgi:hypothetical protein
MSSQLKWDVPVVDKIIVSDVITRIRMKVGDSLINRFSEYEIMNAINEGVNLLWKHLMENYSSVCHKVEYFDMAEGRVALPNDYYTTVEIAKTPIARYHSVSIDGPGSAYQYAHVEGNYIFSKYPIRFIYNYMPRDITRVDDVIDVPLSLEADIVSIASNLLVNNGEGATARAADTANRLSQRREVWEIPDKVAFP